MMEKNWKYYLGLGLLGLSFLPYIIVFGVMPFLSLSGPATLSLASTLLVLSELAFLAALALLGKPFIQMLKSQVGNWLKRPAICAAPKPIGKIRHRIGITLFAATLVLPTLLTELVLFFGLIDSIGQTNVLYWLIVFDLSFITSLLILGGDFWERLKHLFEWPGVSA
jgi:hypothetical protein